MYKDTFIKSSDTSNIPQKYSFFSKSLKGSTVVCVVKAENSEQKLLLKTGDKNANDDLLDDELLEGEISDNEEEFAIQREIFTATFIRLIDKKLTPKYHRFNKIGSTDPLVGVALMEDFVTWRKCYDAINQSVLNYSLSADGYIQCDDELKHIQGLGASAVLLTLLGPDDRFDKNWGLKEKSSYFQVTLIDFGFCLNDFCYQKGESVIPNDPLELIRFVFDRYKGQPPLPKQFYQSLYIQCEMYETINALHEMSFTDIENMAENCFKLFPTFKKKILIEIKLVISNLYNVFKDLPVYNFVQLANKCFKKFDINSKLSELDDKDIKHLWSVYNFTRFSSNTVQDSFEFYIKSMFEKESAYESMSMC